MDALKFAVKEDRTEDKMTGRTGFAVKPREAYQAALAEIAACLANPEKFSKKGQPLARYIEVGGEIRENPLERIYFRRAQRLGPEALRMALAPRASLDPAGKMLREEALELARLWFTESLHQQINYKPIRLHLLADSTVRL